MAPLDRFLRADAPLRVALLTYRGNPHSGGQGVYTHYLSKELVALGHQVEVFCGPPYPEIAPGVDFTPLPSLDLFRSPDPFRVPRLREFRSSIDVLEFAAMCTAGFPEPRTFSLRAHRALRRRRHEFDVVHDNQCLGSGILRLHRQGFPVLATLHHPITVDRKLELEHATTLRRNLTLRRWYGFLAMQKRVVAQLPRVVTVSQSSLRDMVEQMGVRPETTAVVPVGVDTDRFRPLAHIGRVPARLMTTTSSDQPLKGLVPLLEALAKLRTERHDAHLVVIGKLREGSVIPAALARLGLDDGRAVQFLPGVSNDRLVELYAEAELAIVPSLYEGFSLPAIEAMACATPLVATTGGALPEVAGRDGESALLVTPDDPGALASTILLALEDPELRARIGAGGHARVLDRFTWPTTAKGTVEQYWRLLDEHEGRR